MKHWSTDIFEYGEKDDILCHISSAENGLKCNCTCPSCGERLVAVNRIRKGKARPHFRHYSNINCDHITYRETIVHLLAKEIIKEKGFIVLPKISYYLNTNYASYMTSIDPEIKLDSLPLYIEQNIETYDLYFDSIRIEKKKHKIKPDIQVFKNGTLLIIEIAYSHFVDPDKLKKIKDDHLNAIEIDLSHLNKNASKKDIEHEIFNNIYRKTYWLNNEKNDKQLGVRLEQAIEFRNYCWNESRQLKTYANMTRIYSCPLQKGNKNHKYVLVDKDCSECNFFCGKMEDLNTDFEQYKYEEEELIELGEDTSILLEKYDEKTFYKSGTVSCCANLENILNNKITAANKS